MEKPYANMEYYLETYKGKVSGEEIEPFLLQSSFDIDSLTYNRLNVIEPSSAQLDIIQRVCCEMADFNCENQDILESPVQGYSINGVSVQLGDRTITDMNGIIIPTKTYSLLKQTGLCFRGLK